MKKLMGIFENDKEVFYKELLAAEKEQLLAFGTLGEGRELKTVKIWCEKEFGIQVPAELSEDSKLYTHKEVWALLEQYKADPKQ